MTAKYSPIMPDGQLEMKPHHQTGGMEGMTEGRSEVLRNNFTLTGAFRSTEPDSVLGPHLGNSERCQM